MCKKVRSQCLIDRYKARIMIGYHCLNKANIANMFGLCVKMLSRLAWYWNGFDISHATTRLKVSTIVMGSKSFSSDDFFFFYPWRSPPWCDTHTQVKDGSFWKSGCHWKNFQFAKRHHVSDNTRNPADPPPPKKKSTAMKYTINDGIIIMGNYLSSTLVIRPPVIRISLSTSHDLPVYVVYYLFHSFSLKILLKTWRKLLKSCCIISLFHFIEMIKYMFVWQYHYRSRKTMSRPKLCFITLKTLYWVAVSEHITPISG